MYDFTDFLDAHPAGAEAILKYAGKDGTEIFHAIHTAEMLLDFKPIGKLVKGGGGGGDETPSFEAPSFEAPSPSFEAPSFEAPSFEAPAAGKKDNGTRGKGKEEFEAPSFEIPVF